MGEQAGGEPARFLGQPLPVPGCAFTCSLGAGRGRCHSCRGPLRAVTVLRFGFIRQSSAPRSDCPMPAAVGDEPGAQPRSRVGGEAPVT